MNGARGRRVADVRHALSPPRARSVGSPRRSSGWSSGTASGCRDPAEDLCDVALDERPLVVDEDGQARHRRSAESDDDLGRPHPRGRAFLHPQRHAEHVDDRQSEQAADVDVKTSRLSASKSPSIATVSCMAGDVARRDERLAAGAGRDELCVGAASDSARATLRASA